MNIINQLLKLSEFSTCKRLHVSAIIEKNGHIVSSGVNGAPDGFLFNCQTYFKDVDVHHDKGLKDHFEFSKAFELHAEQVAIMNALKNGHDLSESTIWITHSPCHYCAKIIYLSGIKRVRYIHKYDREFSEVMNFLKTMGIDVEQVKINSEG